MTITRGDGKDHRGTMRESPIGLQNGALSFPDPVPHALEVVAACGVLVADPERFMERLELDRDFALFETYDTMFLRRHHGRHDRA